MNKKAILRYVKVWEMAMLVGLAICLISIIVTIPIFIFKHLKNLSTTPMLFTLGAVMILCFFIWLIVFIIDRIRNTHNGRYYQEGFY